MAHNLCIECGKAKLFYCGEVPWHGLGQSLAGPATSEAAIQAAGLDWKVEKVPLALRVGNRHLSIPDHFAMVREDHLKMKDPPVMAIVGRDYTPLQNRDAFRFMDGLVGGQDRAIYHTAGALGQGERVWLLVKLPGTMVVGMDDLLDKYLLLSNSHDGQSSVQMKFTPIRVVCQNTLTMALGNGPSIRIPHRTGIEAGLHWAGQELGLIQDHFENLNGYFLGMVQRPLTSAQFLEYLDAVLPLPEEPSHKDLGAQTRWIQRQERILLNREAVEVLWDQGKGADLSGSRHTLWTAYNAVTELVDHLRRQESPSPSQRAQALDQAWFGDGHRLKSHAFKRAVVLLGKP